MLFFSKKFLNNFIYIFNINNLVQYNANVNIKYSNIRFLN